VGKRLYHLEDATIGFRTLENHMEHFLKSIEQETGENFENQNILLH
jgi:hypothetical protein